MVGMWYTASELPKLFLTVNMQLYMSYCISICLSMVKLKFDLFQSSPSLFMVILGFPNLSSPSPNPQSQPQAWKTERPNFMNRGWH